MNTHGIEIEDLASLSQLKKEADYSLETYQQQLTKLSDREDSARKEHNRVLNEVANVGATIQGKLHEIVDESNAGIFDFVKGDTDIEHQLYLVGSRLKYEALLERWEKGKGMLMDEQNAVMEGILSDKANMVEMIKKAALIVEYTDGLMALIKWAEDNPALNDTYKKLPEPRELRVVASQIGKAGVYADTITFLQMSIHRSPEYYQSGPGSTASAIKWAGDADYWPNVNELKNENEEVI